MITSGPIDASTLPVTNDVASTPTADNAVARPIEDFEMRTDGYRLKHASTCASSRQVGCI
jgi:hypothetical protein